MKSLILPVAGRSSRFPGTRPKWLLTMPDGKLMIEKSLEKLDPQMFDRVIIVCLKEHIDKYFSEKSLESFITNFPIKNVELSILDSPTSSQSETVATALIKENVEGPFFVKDCDNCFETKWSGRNEISTLNLNQVGLVDAKNKSYVIVDGLDNILNIVEKQVISNLFCCGGYGFESPRTFLRHFKSIKRDNAGSEIYISHVIYSMLLAGECFKIIPASEYIDWGTLREYRHYMKTFITVFCDVDGVLLYNGSKFGKKGWCTDPIQENLRLIAKLQESGNLFLVITSSRPENQLDYVRERLASFNVYPDRYIMGLPHTRRILVNDFSSTNPYPSAISINLERDSKELSSILESLIS